MFYRFRYREMKIKYPHALVAESVDALDLKSNRGSPSVPVQVWPRAILKDSPVVGLFLVVLLSYANGGERRSRVFRVA